MRKRRCERRNRCVSAHQQVGDRERRIREAREQHEEVPLLDPVPVELADVVRLLRLDNPVTEPLREGVAMRCHDSARLLRGLLDGDVDAARKARAALPRGSYPECCRLLVIVIMFDPAHANVFERCKECRELLAQRFDVSAGHQRDKPATGKLRLDPATRLAIDHVPRLDHLLIGSSGHLDDPHAPTSSAQIEVIHALRRAVIVLTHVHAGQHRADTRSHPAFFSTKISHRRIIRQPGPSILSARVGNRFLRRYQDHDRHKRIPHRAASWSRWASVPRLTRPPIEVAQRVSGRDDSDVTDRYDEPVATVALSSLGLSDLRPLAGGVSGAQVWRARCRDYESGDVVIKRTLSSELAVLRLLDELDEPALPRLIAAGSDASGPWVVIPFHPGHPVDIMGELPEALHECMGRIHAHFAGRTDGLRNDVDVMDQAYVMRSLTEFGPQHLAGARGVMGEALFARASRLLARLADDTAFRTVVDDFTPTLLHGDLYGLNVLQPHTVDGSPMIIDWNCAKIGPPMYDVAMTSAYDSPARRAHDRGWAQVTGALPDRAENELAHAWATTFNAAVIAGAVAVRASAPDAERMINTAEAGARRLASLTHH